MQSFNKILKNKSADRIRPVKPLRVKKLCQEKSCSPNETYVQYMERLTRNGVSPLSEKEWNRILHGDRFSLR